MTLVLHDALSEQIERINQAQPQVVLLIGSKGSGKYAVARHIISNIFDIEDIDGYPYGKTITAETGKMIGIEAVRELEHFLSLRVPNKAEVDRFVIFEDAHKLTIEAQNALLKTLEEPPRGSMIILTASHAHALLPTIRSRTQTVNLPKPPAAAVEKHFTDQGYSSDEIKRAASISGGLPGLMNTLLSEQEHPLRLATDYARQILSKTAYERLLLVEELSKNRDLSLDTCFILQQMARVSLQTAEGQQAVKWQNVLSAAYNASEQLANSAQPKLVLDNLMLSV